jgi:hypothetical protein
LCRTAIAGADPEYSLPIRIITQKAWHSLFARTMFLKIGNQDALKKHVPEFTVIAVPGSWPRPWWTAPAPTRSSSSISASAGHYRRHQLRRRNQEDHLHRAEFPAAAAGRAAHALLGQRRRTAMSPFSSAFRAPARPRFPPTPSAT